MFNVIIDRAVGAVGRSLLKESILTEYQCTPSARTMECAGRSVLYRSAYFLCKQFSVNWHICMNVEDVPCILSFECRDIEGISDMSPWVSWHFMTRSYKHKEHPLMGNYSLVEHRMVLPYNTIEGKNVVTGNLSSLSLFLFLSI